MSSTTTAASTSSTSTPPPSVGSSSGLLDYFSYFPTFSSLKLGSNAQLGRFLSADRAFARGDLLLQEVPLLVAPSLAFPLPFASTDPKLSFDGLAWNDLFFCRRCQSAHSSTILRDALQKFFTQLAQNASSATPSVLDFSSWPYFEGCDEFKERMQKFSVALTELPRIQFEYLNAIEANRFKLLLDAIFSITDDHITLNPSSYVSPSSAETFHPPLSLSTLLSTQTNYHAPFGSKSNSRYAAYQRFISLLSPLLPPSLASLLPSDFPQLLVDLLSIFDTNSIQISLKARKAKRAEVKMKGEKKEQQKEVREDVTEKGKEKEKEKAMSQESKEKTERKLKKKKHKKKKGNLSSNPQPAVLPSASGSTRPTSLPEQSAADDAKRSALKRRWKAARRERNRQLFEQSDSSDSSDSDSEEKSSTESPVSGKEQFRSSSSRVIPAVGLFPLHDMMMHSCGPRNALYISVPKRKIMWPLISASSSNSNSSSYSPLLSSSVLRAPRPMLTLETYATCPIPVGEPLKISYSSFSYSSSQHRLSHLSFYYGFQCVCDLCAKLIDPTRGIACPAKECQKIRKTRSEQRQTRVKSAAGDAAAEEKEKDTEDDLEAEASDYLFPIGDGSADEQWACQRGECIYSKANPKGFQVIKGIAKSVSQLESRFFQDLSSFLSSSSSSPFHSPLSTLAGLTQKYSKLGFHSAHFLHFSAGLSRVKLLMECEKEEDRRMIRREQKETLRAFDFYGWANRGFFESRQEFLSAPSSTASCSSPSPSFLRCVLPNVVSAHLPYYLSYASSCRDDGHHEAALQVYEHLLAFHCQIFGRTHRQTRQIDDTLKHYRMFLSLSKESEQLQKASDEYFALTAPHCLVCEGAANLRCIGCQNAVYCSKKCQQEHWNVHRTKCRKKLKDVDRP